MNLKWDDIRLFLAVHEHGSLSGAARVLKLGQPTLSRRISEMEQAVGEPLFERLNHGTTLTPAGLKLLPAAQGMAEWANQAELSIGKQTHLPLGKVRITAPPGIAYDIVAPLAAKIRRLHPQIQIEVLSGVEVLNLGRGEADVALRTAKPIDPELLCVDEITSPLRAYASRSYMARLPADAGLDEMDWICWAAPYHDLQANRELRAHIPNFKPAFTSDDFIVQMAACKAGVGVMILPQLLHRHQGLREWGDLVELPTDLGPSAIGTLYLVCHKRQRHLPKVRLVLEFVSREFDALRPSPSYTDPVQ